MPRAAFAAHFLGNLGTKGVGGFCRLAPAGVDFGEPFERISQVMGESVMRQTMAQAIAIVALVGLVALGCAKELARERCFEASYYEPPSGEVSEQAIRLAGLLARDDATSARFSDDDLRRARDLRFYPDFDSRPHATHYDQIGDPETCEVRRTFLNHDGGVGRTTPVSISCPDYWRLVGFVEAFVEERGSLPLGTLEMTVFAKTPRTVEVECSR